MEPTKDRFMEWGKYYCSLNGWKGEAETQMVLIWTTHFRRWGYTSEELFRASEIVAKRENPVVKREDHLSCLRQALHTVRRERTRIEPEEINNRGICAYCRDTGAVSVPLLADVSGDSWNSTRTSAVWCNCWAGKKYAGTSTSSNRSMMGLSEYARKNPFWQIQKTRKEQQDKEADLLFSEASDLNKRCEVNEFDRLRVKLMERFGILKIKEAHRAEEKRTEERTTVRVGGDGEPSDERTDLPF